MPSQLAQFVYTALCKANWAITVSEEQKRLARESLMEARTTPKKARVALF